jgi:hypothetical protein
MSNTPEVNKALENVLARYRSMSKEELKAEFNNHKPGDVAKLMEGVFEDMTGEDVVNWLQDMGNSPNTVKLITTATKEIEKMPDSVFYRTFPGKVFYFTLKNKTFKFR